MTEVKVPNIYQRIVGVMSDLSYIQKSDLKVNNQYRFVSHDQVTAAVHPLLVKHGICIMPTVQSSKQEGNRTEVQLAVGFINIDNPDDRFFVQSFGYGVDASDKGPGKAVSYAFKMACLKVFCLETGEDSDNDAKSVYEAPKCIEFDSMIPEDYTTKQKKQLQSFIEEIATSTGKNVSDIQREALKRPQEFFKAFETKKKDK